MRFTIFFSFLLFSAGCFAQDFYLFVGTYTTGKSEGIYVFRFNAASGKLTPVSTIQSKNPSYLAVSPNGKYLYAVNENGGTKSGGVSAFSFNKATGKLHFLNSKSSGGADPCYVSLNKTGKWAVIANYSGGNLSALRIKADGSLDTLSQLIQHAGNSVNPQRQEKAHVHSVVFSPDEHFLLSADLGMDRESIYRFEPEKHQPLSDARDSFVNTLPGTGPRHLVFHPRRPYAYLIEELTGTIDAFHYSDGRLINFQHISTHPDDYNGEKGSADIHISPNGNFLYASNRGDANNIAIYAIDSTSGKLILKGFQSTLGATPRNFMIDPSGHYLLAANQKTGNIVIFKINRQTGLLQPTGNQVEVPNPVCLKMLKE